MFSVNLRIKGGLAAWTTTLAKRFQGKAKKPASGEAAARAEPQTEGERSLHQAMGWSEDAWAGGDSASEV